MPASARMGSLSTAGQLVAVALDEHLGAVEVVEAAR